jgi:hypothetical protein
MRRVAPLVLGICSFSCRAPGPRPDAIQVTIAYHQQRVVQCCVTVAVVDVWGGFSERHPEIRVADTVLRDEAYRELVSGKVRHDLIGNVVIIVFDSDPDLKSSGVRLVPGMPQLCEDSAARCAGGVPAWVPDEYRKAAGLVLSALADAMNKQKCSLPDNHC